MALVIAGTIGFLLILSANLLVTIQASVQGIGPPIPHVQNQRLLALFAWAFPVVTIWGFSARWVPVFLGLPNPMARTLLAGLTMNVAAVGLALAGGLPPRCCLWQAWCSLPLR